MNFRSPVIAETSGNHSTGLGGTVVTDDSTGFSSLDEAPGSRASYTTDTDNEGEADYSLAFDNESIPGSTKVGIDGMDQDNLLMDVTLSFYEMGIRYRTQNELAFGVSCFLHEELSICQETAYRKHAMYIIQRIRWLEHDPIFPLPSYLAVTLFFRHLIITLCLVNLGWLSQMRS